jgi:hypothetical protein
VDSKHNLVIQMTLINGHDRDPDREWALRKAELEREAEEARRRERRPKLDVVPLTMADVAADQENQNAAIGRAIANARRELEGEIATLREQVTELTTKLAYVEGLLQGSSGAKLKFFTVRGAWRKGERYDRTDVVTRGDTWYVAKRDDPRSVPGSGDDWIAGPVGTPGMTIVGPPGPRGPKGAAGADAARVRSWTVDRATYSLIAVRSDGSKGPVIPLRGLFEAYHSEVTSALEAIVERGVAEMKRASVAPWWK